MIPGVLGYPGLAALGFAAFSAFVWAVFPALSALAGIYAASPDYGHGPVVAAVALVFAFRAWKEAGRPFSAPSPLGAVLFAAGLLLVLLGRWYDLAFAQGGLGSAFLFGLGLAAALAGFTAAVCGTAAARALAFPFAYLACAAPLPVTLTAPVTLWLRDVSTSLAVQALGLLGAPVFREGNVLHLARLSLGVEDACSGLRSLWVLLAVALGLSWWLRTGAFRGCLLCAAGCAFTLVENALRLTLTALASGFLGDKAAEGSFHTATGLFAYGLAVFSLFALSMAFSRRSKDVPGRVSSGPPLSAWSWPGSLRRARRVFAALALTALGCGVFLSAAEARYALAPAEPPPRVPFDVFPRRIGAFDMVREEALPAAQHKKIAPGDALARTYQAPGKGRVKLLALYWPPFAGRTVYEVYGPHLPDGCYPAFGWKRARARDQALSFPGLSGETVQARLFTFGADASAVLFFHKGVHAWKEARLPDSFPGRVWALARSWNGPPGRFEPRYLVSVEAPVEDTEESALGVAAEFLELAAPLLREHGVGAPPATDAGTDAQHDRERP